MPSVSDIEKFKHLIEPFSYDGGEVCCLLLHGYTGSPSEMRPLGDFLARHGFAVSCPLLPGHGTSPRELNKCVWNDWYQAAEEEWKRLKPKHRKTFVIGLSMGGGLALYLAVNNKVDGIVMLASGVKLGDWRLPILPFARRIISKIKKTRNAYARGPNRARFAYEYNPTQSTQELVIFYRHLKKELPKVTAPLLVIHSKNDIIMPFKNTEMVISGIGSTDTKVVALEKAGHVITLSEEKEKIHQKVLEFVSGR